MARAKLDRADGGAPLLAAARPRRRRARVAAKLRGAQRAAPRVVLGVLVRAVASFEWRLGADGDAAGLSFSFVEGELVRAVREGDWVLLDEINLAPAEAKRSSCSRRCSAESSARSCSRSAATAPACAATPRSACSRR